MYNSVIFGELEQHTHRFVWRDEDPTEAPKHYMLKFDKFKDTCHESGRNTVMSGRIPEVLTRRMVLCQVATIYDLVLSL